MSDIEEFIAARKAASPAKWKDFERRYRESALGALLARHRKQAGLSLSELARRMGAARSTLSRIEGRAKDVRMSTIEGYVRATRLPLTLRLVPIKQGRRTQVHVEVVETCCRGPALVKPARGRRVLLPEFEAMWSRAPGSDAMDDLEAMRGDR